MQSQADKARTRPHLYLMERWGPVAPELVRQARLYGHQIRLMEGWTFLDAGTAGRARNHVREVLALVRGKVPPRYESLLREFSVGLKGFKAPAGRKRTDKAMFARCILVRWQGLDLAVRDDGRGEELPDALDWRDLLALARHAGVERCDKSAPEVDREWRRLCPETAQSQRESIGPKTA